MDRAGIARRIGLGERAARATGGEQCLERRQGGRGDPRELVGELELEPPALGPQHLRTPRPTGRVREREELIDPCDECRLRIGGGLDRGVDPGAHRLVVGVEEREHQRVLRREVPVERPCREPRLRQHVGDGEAGGTVASQHGERGLDETAGLGEGARACRSDGAVGHASGDRVGRDFGEGHSRE